MNYTSILHSDYEKTGPRINSKLIRVDETDADNLLVKEKSVL